MCGLVTRASVLTLALFLARCPSTLGAEWARIETPHFTLLTDADPRTGRNVALEFERARALLQGAVADQVEVALPIDIFAVRDRLGLSALLPGLSGELPLGVFLHSPDRYRIAVRLDEPRNQRFQAAYHEYHHLLLRSATGYRHTPIWLVEGLAEFWSSMEARGDDRLELGRPNPRHLRTLKLRGTMPLGRLLRYEGNVHEEPRDTVAQFYAQSWGLVHYLMLGGSDRSPSTGRARFDRYLELVNDGASDGEGEVDPVTAFERVFGATQVVESGLRRYLDQAMFPAMTVVVPESPAASMFRITELSEALSQAEIGMFVATGPWPENALPHFERALALDPNTTRAMEGQGFVAFRKGQLEAAESWFAKAATADGTSYLAHYYLGVLVKARMGNSHTIVASLERAIELNPRFGPAYVTLSDHLSEDPNRLEEALALAREATRLEPGEPQPWSNLASVLTRMGRLEEADEASQRARENARTKGRMRVDPSRAAEPVHPLDPLGRAQGGQETSLSKRR